MSFLRSRASLRAQLAPALASRARAPLVPACQLHHAEEEKKKQQQPPQQWQLRTAAAGAAALILGTTMAPAPVAHCANSPLQRTAEQASELVNSVGRRVSTSASSQGAAEPRVAEVGFLPSLPYAEDALEPYIDTTTMNIHYNKHHQTYVTNLGKALEKAPELKGKDLVALQGAVGTSAVPQGVASAVRNSGGGHWNHSFFWRVMTPASNAASDYGKSASPELKAAIEKKFGSLDALKESFSTGATAVFGSGWQWLGVDDSKELVLSSTANQDNPLMKGVVDKPNIPILGLDVWEHAYYLKHQNKRPAYLQDWWHVVNWQQVSDNYAVALQGKVPTTATSTANQGHFGPSPSPK